MTTESGTGAPRFLLRGDGVNRFSDLLMRISEAHDQLLRDFNALQAKYTALLAHLDGANLPGISGSALTSFGAPPSSATAPSIE